MGRLKAHFKVHAIRLAQRRTSVSLEDAFWESLRAIATERGTSIQDLIAGIDSARHDIVNLSSAIRIFVLEYYMGMSVEHGTSERTTNPPAGAENSKDTSHSLRP